MSRGRGRKDSNHHDIAAAFARCGWYVHDTSGLGDGFMDLVIARAGRLELIEVKDGFKSLSRQALTPAEALVHRYFAAAGVPVRMIRSIADALAL